MLLTSGILSLIVSFTLKKLFSVPRPAAVFDNDSFEIIGRTLTGNTSLPSGHSISAFFVITIFLFAFMPKKKLNKLFWSFFMLIIGLVIAFSRVGVGAHYPIDVVIGGTIGYIIAIVSIKLNQKFKWLNWIGDKKYYLFFIILFIISFIQIIRKILETNLLIFYISLLFLFLTLFTLIKSYAKKIKLSIYALIFSFVNLILYQYPFFKFVSNNFDIGSVQGFFLITSLIIISILLNTLIFYIGLYLLRSFGKWILVFFFITNAIAVYFVNTYGVFIDKTMIGNIVNTNYEEASSFFSLSLVVYIIILGIIPSILVFKIKYKRESLKIFFNTNFFRVNFFNWSCLC